MDQNSNNYLIYAYEELTTHSVYVGLTKDLKNRDLAHRKYTGKRDKLYKFCIERNLEIPQPKILKENLSPEEAKNYESLYWHQYKDAGWNMINTEGALGALGGNRDKVWTEEKIRNYLKEHPEITKRGQLNESSRPAYRRAQELNLLDELFGEVERKPYTREDIYAYMKKHPEIKNREDLRSAASGVFKAAWRFGMLDEFFGEATKHTEEEIRAYLAEHPEIKRRIDLQNQNRNLYEAAKRLELLQKLFGDRENKPITKEDILNFIKEHPEIKKRKDLDNANRSLYQAAKRFRMLDDLFGDKQNKEYSEDEVREYVKNHPEIKRIIDLMKQNNRLYQAGLKFKILDELFPTKYQRKDSYNEEDIRKYLKEHPEINSRTKLLEANKQMYYRARQFKLLNLIEDGRTSNRKWTEKTIRQFLEENSDIKRKADLRNKAGGAYYRARELKILDELFPKE